MKLNTPYLVELSDLLELGVVVQRLALGSNCSAKDFVLCVETIDRVVKNAVPFPGVEGEPLAWALLAQMLEREKEDFIKRHSRPLSPENPELGMTLDGPASIGVELVEMFIRLAREMVPRIQLSQNARERIEREKNNG
jgi:hypothetical protein